MLKIDIKILSNMKKIIIIGGGAMGSAFTIPCLENNNNVTITEPYSKRFIKDLSSKNKFHSAYIFIAPMPADHKASLNAVSSLLISCAPLVLRSLQIKSSSAFLFLFD